MSMRARSVSSRVKRGVTLGVERIMGLSCFYTRLRKLLKELTGSTMLGERWTLLRGLRVIVRGSLIGIIWLRSGGGRLRSILVRIGPGFVVISFKVVHCY